jgi:Holliday junction resolvase RusA-like endonuclease
MISFFVPGIPAPQGSKRAFVVGKRAVLVESSKGCKPWRDSVRGAALEANALRAMPFEGFVGAPLRLRIVFVMPRPRTVPRERCGWPATIPDLDKLLRSTLDGLTGALFRDDGQVVQIEAEKHYVGSTAGNNLTPGAWIRCDVVRCRHTLGANRRGRCVDCGEVM